MNWLAKIYYFIFVFLFLLKTEFLIQYILIVVPLLNSCQIILTSPPSTPNPHSLFLFIRKQTTKDQNNDTTKPEQDRTNRKEKEPRKSTRNTETNAGIS